MLEKRKSYSNLILSVLFLAQIVLVILKITGKIKWSWWKVFTPTYITIGLFIFSYVIMALVGSKS